MFLILFVLTAGSESIKADGDSLKKYTSPGVVVTATRYGSKVSDIASSVSVVNIDEINISNSYMSTDLLEEIPGVDVMRNGYFGRTDVVIRGIGNRGRRLGILVDGKPQKMSIFGCSVTQVLPLHNLRRIEVVRGPLSSLYGSGSMGGVVNIITEQPPEETELEFRSSYGSNNTYVAGGYLGTSISRVNISGGLQKSYSDGHLDNSSADIEDYKVDVKYNPAGDWDIMSSFNYTDSYKETPATITTTSEADGWQVYRRGNISIKAEGDLHSTETQVQIFRNYGHHEFSDGWESMDHTDGIKTKFDFFPLVFSRITAGLDYSLQHGDNLSGGEWDRKIYEGFVHTEKKTDFVNISGGIRYTYDSETGGTISYDGGTVFKYKDTRLRIRGGKGFRLPSFSDLYAFPSSNQNLIPEELYSLEAGLRQNLFKLFSLDLSVYYQKTDNFIRFSPENFKFENIDSLTEKGMELNLNIYPSEGLTLTAGYNYIDRGDRTGGIPGNKLFGKLNIRRSNFSVLFKGKYVSDYYALDRRERPIDSYAVFDLSCNLYPADWLNLMFSMDNILNEEYERFVDVPNVVGIYEMPGRTLKVGMIFKR